MKEYFKRLWNAIWDSTDIDEKAEAAKGKKRRGKKPYKKYKKKTNNNSKKQKNEFKRT